MVNPLNHATLEASQRLHAKGIVLETEAVWCHYSTDKFSHPNKWSLGYRGLVESDPRKDDRPFIPAPSMAEVWRELPEMIPYCHKVYWLTLIKGSKASIADYVCTDGSSLFIAKGLKAYENTNPTDALIDLLIHIKGLDTHK
jgi:hypothetical protein